MLLEKEIKKPSELIIMEENNIDKLINENINFYNTIAKHKEIDNNDEVLEDFGQTIVKPKKKQKYTIKNIDFENNKDANTKFGIITYESKKNKASQEKILKSKTIHHINNFETNLISKSKTLFTVKKPIDLEKKIRKAPAIRR